MIKLHEAIARTGVDVLDHLDREAGIPLLTGLQRQGDVGFLPAAIFNKATPAEAPKPVPPQGVPLVAGRGGHTHLLIADGPVTWAPVSGREIGDVGVFVVPAGATAFVAHPEHGYLGFAPGAYLVRRQVEQADELRVVAD